MNGPDCDYCLPDMFYITDDEVYNTSNCPHCAGTGMEPTPFEEIKNGIVNLT
jgi:predicted Zn-ribbon and HTH transcriptional regulator